MNKLNLQDILLNIARRENGDVEILFSNSHTGIYKIIGFDMQSIILEAGDSHILAYKSNIAFIRLIGKKMKEKNE